MPCCQLCSSVFPNRVRVDGKVRNLHSRKYCLKCSPFGRHNTKKIHTATNEALPGTKRCGDCSQIFLVEEFPLRDKGKSRRSTCTQCTLKRGRRYERKRARKQKCRAVDFLGGHCALCKKKGPICIFDFHHTGKKESTLSQLWCRGWDSIRQELLACQLLCVNCHRAIHYGDTTAEPHILAYRAKRIALIAYKGGNCKKCGYNKCPAALDFHHRIPSEKRFKIADQPYSSLETLKVEADKCALLCAVCHRLEHATVLVYANN